MNQEDEKLYRALKGLIVNCVDRIGLPKKPTVKQLQKAIDAINKYERVRNARAILESWKK